jgi:hypothetical protein
MKPLLSTAPLPADRAQPAARARLSSAALPASAQRTRFERLLDEHRRALGEPEAGRSPPHPGDAALGAAMVAAAMTAADRDGGEQRRPPAPPPWEGLDAVDYAAPAAVAARIEPTGRARPELRADAGVTRCSGTSGTSGTTPLLLLRRYALLQADQAARLAMGSVRLTFRHGPLVGLTLTVHRVDGLGLRVEAAADRLQSFGVPIDLLAARLRAVLPGWTIEVIARPCDGEAFPCEARDDR